LREEDVTVIQNLTAAVMTENHAKTEIAARPRAEGGHHDLLEFNTLQLKEITGRKQA
jgi:hypothetical protein